MKKLSETWFAEGRIDFELKKYTLLAYLQEINRCFTENKLYPQLADLVFHYNNVVAFRENKKYLQEHFPKKFTGVQLQKLEFLYEQLLTDDELMQELEEIINYAAHNMKGTISNGAEIYEWVEQQLSINPVGLVPLDTQEGYFFLSAGSKETRVYQYRLSFFEKKEEKYRSIQTSVVDIQQRSLANSYENIKCGLLRRSDALPNPAVYSIEINLSLPIEETLLPVSKRSLVKLISVG